MIGLEQITSRPAWLKVRWAHNDNFHTVDRMVNRLQLHTVCQEARCPNIYECWGEHRTATFMILGDECTRHCGYCAVASSKQPSPPDPAEPRHIAEGVLELGLRHAVITSVDRDDLEDAGAGHFVDTMLAIRRAAPGCRIEVLIPDFNGSHALLERVLAAGPDVLAHNLETVRSIFPGVRSKGDYDRSIALLRQASGWSGVSRPVVKSGLMVGLGEEREEIVASLRDLRTAGCNFVTMGQYLPPTPRHAALRRYYSPAEFDDLADTARALGFDYVESGPLVRSSYHAHLPFTLSAKL